MYQLYEISWPPPPATNIPYTLFGPGGVATDGMFQSLSVTLKTIGSTTLLLMAVFYGTFAIYGCFKVLLLNKLHFENSIGKRMIARKVREEDLRRNFDDVVEEKLRGRFLSRVAQTVDYARNFEEIAAFQARNRELSRRARNLDVERNYEDIVESKVQDMEINEEARKRFRARQRNSVDYHKEIVLYYKGRHSG